MRPVLALLLCLCFVAAFLASCGGGDDGLGGNPTQTVNQHPSDPDFAALASRPLKLPSAQGGNCPVTDAQLLSPTQPFVLGQQPVYATGMGSSSVLRLSPVAAGGDWLTNYVVWLGVPGFSGKVLVRGARIDGDGAVGFDYAPLVQAQPTADHLQLDTATTAVNGDGWYEWATYPRMKEPGCYAFQVDTDADSYTIVFRAELAAGQ